jgi:hypothetical protein
VEVLTTPLGGMFPSVTTEPSAILLFDLPDNSLKHGKVSLSPNSAIIVNETMRILHGPPTPFVLVFTHTDSESGVLIGRFRGGRRVTVECLSMSILLMDLAIQK